jgi:archaellum biogenesis ATPase FlaH
MSEPESSPKGFPRELLEQSIEERLHYFDKVVVAHQILKQTYDDLRHAIRHPASASIILVFGPTGVGKTTLRQQIERQLIKDALANPDANPGHIPVVGMEAVSPDSGNFNWRDYYVRALQALDEPMLEDKITYALHGIHRDEQGKLVIERSVTATDMRRVLEKCLQNRRPRAFIVDEAQHFQTMASGERLLDQMNSLKSLASLTKTVHVLVGTYDLLELTKLNAQLSRRCIKIHFPRYRADNEDDFREFKKLLRTLQKYLPLPEEPDLGTHADYFYDQCLGCIGMLKSWLYRTLAAALELNQSTITQELWEKHTEAPGTLLSMFDEIRWGEDDFWGQKDESQLEELRSKLRIVRKPNPNKETKKTTRDTPKGTNPPPSSQSDPSAKKDSTPVPPTQSGSSSKEDPPAPLVKPPKRNNKRVGLPNPVRRPVGQEEPRAG